MDYSGVSSTGILPFRPSRPMRSSWYARQNNHQPPVRNSVRSSWYGRRMTTNGAGHLSVPWDMNFKVELDGEQYLEGSSNDAASTSNRESRDSWAESYKYPDEIELEEEAGKEYPHGLKLVVLILTLQMSVLLFALDTTILTTAIPSITSAFNTTADVGWYASAYLLTECVCQLLYGKLYGIYPAKWIFLTALAIFEIGSAICGASTSSPMLVGARAISGVGAAGLFSGALIIVGKSTPVKRRPMFIGLLGVMYALAGLIGPLLGGVLAEDVSWRWCFYINLPIGATAWVILLFVLKAEPAQKDPQQNNLTLGEKIKRIDPISLTLFAGSIVSLLLALQWGGSTYAWTSATIIALFVVFAVLLVFFAAFQWWMKDEATIPMRLLIRPTIAGYWFSFCIGSTLFTLSYWVPIYFQGVKGVDAIESGIRVLPMILSVSISAMIAGITTELTGYFGPFMLLTTILAPIGCGMLSTLQVDSGSPAWIGYQALTGIGIGFGLQQSAVAVQNVLHHDDISVGTTLVVFCSTLGGSIFTTVAQTVFDSSLATALATDAPGVSYDVIITAGASGLRTAVSSTQLPGVLTAYDTAVTTVFIVAIGTAAATLFGSAAMPWINIKPPKEPSDEEEKPGKLAGLKKKMPWGKKAVQPPADSGPWGYQISNPIPLEQETGGGDDWDDVPLPAEPEAAAARDGGKKKPRLPFKIVRT